MAQSTVEPRSRSQGRGSLPPFTSGLFTSKVVTAPGEGFDTSIQWMEVIASPAGGKVANIAGDAPSRRGLRQPGAWMESAGPRAQHREQGRPSPGCATGGRKHDARHSLPEGWHGSANLPFSRMMGEFSGCDCAAVKGVREGNRRWR